MSDVVRVDDCIACKGTGVTDIACGFCQRCYTCVPDDVADHIAELEAEVARLNASNAFLKAAYERVDADIQAASRARFDSAVAEVARLKAELAAVNGEDHADRCAQSKRLREELRAMREEREWRDIRTAPRDVEKALLAHEDMDVFIGFQPAKDGKWVEIDADDGRWEVKPTHWMPLPEPPKEKP